MIKPDTGRGRTQVSDYRQAARKGIMALVGSGEYLEPMEPVDRFLLSRLDGEARVVCLPTAAGTEGEEKIAYWSRLGVEHFSRLGARAEAVRVVDRASAEDETLAERIRAANFVYLSGGKPDYLARTLEGTPALAAITAVLEAGGVVAGCSAGAMVMGEKIMAFKSLRPGQPGFNWLPGALVIPHFDEIPSAVVSVAHNLLPNGLGLVGVEGDTALVVGPEGCTVVGSGKVLVWRGKQRRVLQEGHPTLPDLWAPGL